MNPWCVVLIAVYFVGAFAQTVLAACIHYRPPRGYQMRPREWDIWGISPINAIVVALFWPLSLPLSLLPIYVDWANEREYRRQESRRQ